MFVKIPKEYEAIHHPWMFWLCGEDSMTWSINGETWIYKFNQNYYWEPLTSKSTDALMTLTPPSTKYIVCCQWKMKYFQSIFLRVSFFTKYFAIFEIYILIYVSSVFYRCPEVGLGEGALDFWEAHDEGNLAESKALS